MTLIELRYLVAVAETQHFGRAAARFKVSQPTLSMAVRNLEQDLGLLIFERSKNGIRATDAGAGIISQARQVLAQADLIETLAQADKDQLNGEFKLGAIPSLAPYLLPQLIPQMRLLASGLRLAFHEANAVDLGAKLKNGELDAILVSQPFTQVEVVTQELYREPLMAVMPPNHPLAAKKQVTGDDLLGQPFIHLQSGHCLREQILAWCPQLSAADNKLETSSLETLRHMIAIGLGVSILPSSAAVSSVYANHSLTARPLQQALTRTLALAWRASYPRHKAIDAIRRAIQTCSWHFTTGHDNLGSGLLVENQSW